MALSVGDRFTVSAPHEVRNDKQRLLARYLPEFDYRVTSRNVGIVNQMLADGVAKPGGHALERETGRQEKSAGLRIGSGSGRLRGAVSVKNKGKK